MSGYSQVDLIEGWEFKILRSATGAFRDPIRLRKALEEEARAGWTLVEKFDDKRVRLKRSSAARNGDAALGFDAYRTSYGMSESKVTLVFMSIIFSLVASVLLVIFIMTR